LPWKLWVLGAKPGYRVLKSNEKGFKSVIDMRAISMSVIQGCQIFVGTTFQNGGKYIKSPQNLPNGYKVYELAVNRLNSKNIY
jgi:hypothetical protein